MVTRKGGRKGGATPPRQPPTSAASPQPWKIRYARRILAEDIPSIGHAAFETAKKAIRKKLPLDPHQYGDGVRPPLDGICKLKSSHVRVAYHIEEAEHEVWILMIADRSDVWDRHEEDILGRLGVMLEEKRQRGDPPGSRKARRRER